jgi:hypothetical protein
MKWSNLEMDVGILSARWPKIETTYWNALRESVDVLRHMMQMLNDRFDAVEQDADLSPQGRIRRRVDIARDVLSELSDYAPMTKAANAVARRVANLKEKLTVLPATPTSAAEISLAAEIRSIIRAKPEPERFAFDLRSDAKVVQAILSGPASLSGLTDEAVGRIRDAALEALHPNEVAEIAHLEAAEKVARQAVKHAQERIAKRAEMRQDTDGAWRHTSEPSPTRISESAAA